MLDAQLTEHYTTIETLRQRLIASSDEERPAIEDEIRQVKQGLYAKQREFIAAAQGEVNRVKEQITLSLAFVENLQHLIDAQTALLP